MSDTQVIPIKPQESSERLKSKENMVRALVELHAVMGEGSYPGKLTGRLYNARVFLEQMHVQALTDLQTDPEWIALHPKEPNGTQETGPTPQAPSA